MTVATLKRTIPTDNIVVRRGDDYEITWRTSAVDAGFTPIVLGDWGIAAQVRANADSDTVLVDLDPTLSADENDPTILVVTVRLLSADTADYEFTSGVYDIEATDPDGNVVTIGAGEFKVEHDVTRPAP